jgi:hypothetical protein
MVESSDAKEGVFGPTENEKKLMLKHLGDDAHVDSGYKGNFLLSKVEADKRKEIVSDIEYEFQLALQKGEYYLGNAVINFYVNRLPQENELFINCNALAVSHLMVNDQNVATNAVYKNHRIWLDKPQIVLGWNTVQLRYMSKYQTNSVGLHTYTDKSDNL